MRTLLSQMSVDGHMSEARHCLREADRLLENASVDQLTDSQRVLLMRTAYGERIHAARWTFTTRNS